MTTTDIESKSRTSDSAIVARAADGDVAAFETLYRRHVGRVYALCLRMTGNVSAAEDLTQSAFVKAWERLGQFGGRSAFGTWLHRLTVNLVLDARRRSTREDALDDDATPEAPRGLRVGTKVDLERAIRELPEQARIVFVLHDVEGYTHRDIATALGVTEGTTKTQLHRARRKLRESLSR